MTTILQTTFSNVFSWMKMYEFRLKISQKFLPKGPINYISSLVQIMAWRRPGDKWTSSGSIWWYNDYLMEIIPVCLVILLTTSWKSFLFVWLFYDMRFLCVNSERFIGDMQLGFSLRCVCRKSPMRLGSYLVTAGPPLEQTISILWICYILSDGFYQRSCCVCTQPMRDDVTM